MSSEQSLKDVVKYNELPNTPEKEEIDRQFLNDEIGCLDFYSKVREYLYIVGEIDTFNGDV